MAGRKSTSASRARNTKAHREFVSEAEELLERMREDLSDLHDQRAAGDVDPDLVNRIFRSAHSLKGLAGMFGFDGIGELAHHLEEVLDGLRLGRVAFDSPAVALLDEAVALFTTLLQHVGDAGTEHESIEAVAELAGRIEIAVQPPAAAATDLSGLDLDPSLMRVLTEYEEHRLRENLRLGRGIALVDTMFEIIAFEEGLAELSSAVREVGEVISTLPAPGETPESQIRFSLLVATNIPAHQLSARLESSGTHVRVVRDSGSALSASAGEPEPGPEIQAPRFAVDAGDASIEAMIPPESQSGEAPGIESLKSISDTVRVDIRKLDDLMNLVGELVIQHSAVSQIAARLSRDSRNARIGADLLKVHKVMERKLKDLQAGVLEARMVPLRQVFDKLSRVVRRLRLDLGKDVQLECRGADTELDKLIVEELIDPLMHIVRNAFDHAMEPADERLANGKPAQGTIAIQAFQRGNHVVLQVRDDGRGIDPALVRARAEDRGLISADAVLTTKETFELVFAPGFSTRDEVSGTSGRGVGMDVVRSNLTAVGGIVDIDSSCGQGTTLTLTLPITLAIIQALIVGVGDQRFAIPLNSVLETLLVDETEIQRSEDREILNLRGKALMLRRLAVEFGLDAPGAGTKQHAVVLGLGDLRLGLLVDRLEGQQDTVIKAIQGPIQRVHGIAGATELGDQGAILVIDVSALVEDAVRRREAA